MRKTGIIVGALIGILMLPLLMVGISHATSFRSGDNVTISQGEVVDSTVFVAGQTIEIAGEINGDVFCAGNNVSVTGIVHGDVICAGQTVQVSGTVDGDVRLAGSVVNVEGKVDGNATVAGQTVTLHADAKVRDLSAGGSNVVISGSVVRDASVAGEVVDINGTIGRDVQAESEHLSFGSKSSVNGAVTYRSHSELQRAAGAKITGNIKRETPVDRDHDDQSWSNFVLNTIPYMIATSLVTSLILVLVVPRLYYSVSQRGMRQAGWSILAGIGMLIFAPIAVILTAVTVVGLPLAIIAGLGWGLILALSGSVFSFMIGRLLLQTRTTNAIYYMLLGTAVMVVLYLIPVINVATGIVSLIFGMGAIVLELIGRTPHPHYQLALSTAKSKRK